MAVVEVRDRTHNMMGDTLGEIAARQNVIHVPFHPIDF